MGHEKKYRLEMITFYAILFGEKPSRRMEILYIIYYHNHDLKAFLIILTSYKSKSKRFNEESFFLAQINIV